MNNETQLREGDHTFYLASVGHVVDVATPTAGKPRALGFFWALMGLFPLVIINYLIVAVLTGETLIGNSRHSLVGLGGLALVPLFGWYAFGCAIQRFHAASQQRRYFRAGPGGIAVCVPDDSLKTTFLFSFKAWEFDVPWDQVRTWYPFIRSVNGISTERSIVFETLDGKKISVKTYNFKETHKQIAENIRQAALIAVPVSTASPAAKTDSQPASLPAGVAESSLEIKKKRERLKEIDLTTVFGVQRVGCFDRIATLTEDSLFSLFHKTAGYRCSRKRYQPFPGRKGVFGVRLYARRGLLEGYELQVEPNDFEYRKVCISLSASNLISDIRKYISITVGVIFVLLSLRWLPEIQRWLGEFSRLTPIVVLFAFLAALGVCAGALQIPISLLRLFGVDRHKEESQKRSIRSRIEEIALPITVP